MNDSITFSLPDDLTQPLGRGRGNRSADRCRISDVQHCPTCGYPARIEHPIEAGSHSSFMFHCENGNCGDRFELSMVELELIA